MKKLLSLFVMLLCISGMNAAEVKVRLTADLFKSWTTAFADATPKGTAGCAYVIGTSTDMPYGDGNVYWTNYANFPESYKKLVVIAASGQPRFLLNRTVDNGTHVGIPNDAAATAKYQTIEDNGDGTKSYVIDLAQLYEDYGFAHLHAIKGANWQPVTVTKMYIVKEGVIEAGETEEVDEAADDSPSGNLSIYNYVKWNGAGKDATIIGKADGNEGVFGTVVGTAWGHGAVWNDHYVDLSKFTKLEITVANGATPRPLFNRQMDGSGILDLGNSNDLKNKYVTVSAGDGGTLYTVNIKKLVEDYGFAHLQCIKGANYANISIVSLKVRGAQEDINDLMNLAVESGSKYETATLLDATAWNGSEIVTANPNCIILANEGTVANDHNVLVDGTINKLQLTDGYPLVLPENAFNANGGYYTRTVTSAYSTACLPLCFSFSGEGVYMFDGMDGDVINFRELVGGDMGGLKGSYPFLLKGAGEINMYDGGQIYHEWNYEYETFTGTYAGKTLTSDANKTYYGIKDGKIVKVGNNVTVAPFRAYFQFDTASEAKSLKLNLGDETAINSVVEGLNSARAFYNAAGVRQNGLQKGLNIVEMGNGVTRKIMIK